MKVCMRRLFIICVVCLCAVFPLSARQHFAVKANPSPFILGPVLGGLGAGGGFEAAFAPMFSIDAFGYYVGSGIDFGEGVTVNFSLYSAGGAFRWYPFGTAPGGFFVGLGGNWIGISGSVTDPSSGKTGGSFNFGNVGGSLGYKFVFGRDAAVGFFLEPFASYYYSFIRFDELTKATSMLMGIDGFSAGLTLGITF